MKGFFGFVFFKFCQQEIIGRFLPYPLCPSAPQIFWTLICNRPILPKDMVRNKTVLQDTVSLSSCVSLLSFKITSIMALHIRYLYFLFKDLSHRLTQLK